MADAIRAHRASLISSAPNGPRASQPRPGRGRVSSRRLAVHAGCQPARLVFAPRGCSASHSFSALFMRVCQPGPPALKAPRTSRSTRIATCSLVGFLLGPLVRRNVAIVASTPPPRVTVAFPQSLADWAGTAADAALAAAICAALKGFEVGVRFIAVGISTGDHVRDVVAARRPDQIVDAICKSGNVRARAGVQPGSWREPDQPSTGRSRYSPIRSCAPSVAST